MFNALGEATDDGEEFLNQNFNGSLNSIVECKKCLNKSIKKEIFNDVSLTIKNPFENICNDSLDKAISTALKKELLSGDNQYFCEKCNSKQDALIYREYSDLPNILTLVIMRFDFDYETLTRVKINDSFSYQKEIKGFAGSDQNYELYSVIVHSGTATGGHYYAYIKTDDGNKLIRFVALFQRQHSYPFLRGRSSKQGWRQQCSLSLHSTLPESRLRSA